jgi:hypothetical protein
MDGRRATALPDEREGRVFPPSSLAFGLAVAAISLGALF